MEGFIVNQLAASILAGKLGAAAFRMLSSPAFQAVCDADVQDRVGTVRNEIDVSFVFYGVNRDSPVKPANDGKMIAGEWWIGGDE